MGFVIETTEFFDSAGIVQLYCKHVSGYDSLRKHQAAENLENQLL